MYFEKFPIIFLDIGARGGLPQHWKPAQKYLKIISFEPDERSIPSLPADQRSNQVFIRTPLYKEKTKIHFNLTRKPGVSSILQPNRSFLGQFPRTERFDVMKTFEMEADTVDHQLEAQHIDGANFLKLDTQGSELFILEGAKKNLRESVFGIEIETEFAELYENQPLFPTVHRFLEEFHFTLFDLKPSYSKRAIGKDVGGAKGQIMFADALYFKNHEVVSKMIQETHDLFEKKSKALRCLSIIAVYGYLDYALFVLQTLSSVFTEHEFLLIKNTLSSIKSPAMRMPNFPGRETIANGLYKLFCLFRPTSGGWAGVSKEIGNRE